MYSALYTNFQGKTSTAKVKRGRRICLISNLCRLFITLDGKKRSGLR